MYTCKVRRRFRTDDSTVTGSFSILLWFIQWRTSSFTFYFTVSRISFLLHLFTLFIKTDCIFWCNDCIEVHLYYLWPTIKSGNLRSWESYLNDLTRTRSFCRTDTDTVDTYRYLLSLVPDKKVCRFHLQRSNWLVY